MLNVGYKGNVDVRVPSTKHKGGIVMVWGWYGGRFRVNSHAA